jgi:hypothetical protein
MKEGPMNRVRKEMPATLAIAALLFSALPIFSQAQNASPVPAAVPAPASATAQPAGPVLVAKIVGNLSTKNAKAGDVITAKTLRPIKEQDGNDIPKGSKIIGKLSTVHSKKDGDGKSLLAFRFDEIELKGGGTVPIHGLVVAIGPSLAPKEILGANSVLTRNATDMANVLDPNTGIGTAGAMDEYDIPLGSRLPGVGLGRHKDADWTTALLGIHQDIDLDSDVLIKVLLK